MSLVGMSKEQKTPQQMAKKTVCGPCPKCGQTMDDAGWGYCRCMNASCERMGQKVKA